MTVGWNPAADSQNASVGPAMPAPTINTDVLTPEPYAANFSMQGRVVPWSLGLR